ncbi:MAG TPA: protein kinase, partial [Verrucomicrobiae bacterium]|nr:protein kinase [Verrucomicrobiae bacterium]
GLEDSGSTHALVMELVEGPTLADRIRSGPIPVDEALKIAKQICEALEYAHERGIVHRDLKPANVKVTADDAVKVLDFGLAKALEGDASSIDISTSPTLSRLATMQGILLGTAAYMSPEQAKGKSVDRRADIWAFGCVLYEMLTGKIAFGGETVTDTLAAVIRAEPDWSLLPAETPIRVRVLLQRCLQKDPKQRLRDIGDARISLDEVLSGAPEAALAGTPAEPAPRWRRALPWAVAALIFAALAPPLALLYLRQVNPPPAEPVRFQISAPPNATVGNFALSPDGRQLAFTAIGSDKVVSLWIRPLNSLEARRLAGSESTGIVSLFWSPDSRYIAYDDRQKLKRIDVSSGEVETLCDVPGQIVLGGAWNRDGVIVLGQYPGPLLLASASGGSASPLTSLDSSQGEVADNFPVFLPNGKQFLYQRVSGAALRHTSVYVGSLNGGSEEKISKEILKNASDPVYVPSSTSAVGQLLFTRNGALMAQPLDTQRLELLSEPVIVVGHVRMFRGHGFFSASSGGALVYSPPDNLTGSYQPVWYDRQGKTLGTAGEAGDFSGLSLSPEGTRATISRVGAESAIWLVDFARGTSERFTFGASIATNGIWSPDGNRIIFATLGGTGVSDLYEKPSSGASDAQLLLASSESKSPTSWSRDGSFLLFTAQNPKTTRAAICVLPLTGDKKPFPFLHGDFDYQDGQISPDGRLIAYSSDESGRDEVYVRTFSPNPSTAASGSGGKWLISAGGGFQPRWSENGKELYYIAADGKLMAVEVGAGSVFQAGVPRVLFQTAVPGALQSRQSWDLTPDGKRFLILTPAQVRNEVPFTVLLNWQAGLNK